MLKKVGKFEILEKLGEGGMGVIYKGFDPAMERLVAVKTLSATTSEDERLKSRFRREAIAVGRLSHKNIVTVYELLELERNTYIVMEFLDGQNLHDALRSGKASSLHEKLRIVMEVCEGLSQAHSMQVIHRDIKPGNIFLTADGQVKILDFGLARLTSSNTLTRATMGTPAYMSPEQWSDRRLDHRTDIFSLGVVLYELLTGRKPFAAESAAAVGYKVVHTEPEAVRTVNPLIPEELSAIVAHALAKNVSERYSDVAEMQQDLARFQGTLAALSRSAEQEVEAATSPPNEKLAPRPGRAPLEPELRLGGAAAGATAAGRLGALTSGTAEESRSEESRSEETDATLRVERDAERRARTGPSHTSEPPRETPQRSHPSAGRARYDTPATMRRPYGGSASGESESTTRMPAPDESGIDEPSGGATVRRASRFLTVVAALLAVGYATWRWLPAPEPGAAVSPDDGKSATSTFVDVPASVTPGGGENAREEPPSFSSTASTVEPSEAARAEPREAPAVERQAGAEPREPTTTVRPATTSTSAPAPAASGAPPAPAPSMGTVLLESNAPARVRVDGNVVGATNDGPLSLRLSADTHRIVLTTENGARREEEVVLRAGQTVSRFVQFDIYGSLSVTSDTWVQVSLEGHPLKQTPAFFERVHVGRHRLRLHREGYEEQVLEVDVQEGELTPVRVVMKEARP